MPSIRETFLRARDPEAWQRLDDLRDLAQHVLDVARTGVAEVARLADGNAAYYAEPLEKATAE